MLHLSGPAPWLLAWLAGTAVQLFQPVLWSASAYALTVLGGWLICMLCRWVARRISSARSHALVLLRFCAALCAGGALAFALTGARALWFSQDALDPALEGVDLQVTGVVSSMPQWHSDGVRFGFQVEQAQIPSLAGLAMTLLVVAAGLTHSQLGREPTRSTTLVTVVQTS